MLTVVGARPQFIKAAPLSRALQKTDNVNEALVHTGQHFDDNMSDVFFRELGIPAPRHNLHISGGSHGRMTGQMLEAIEEVLKAEQADGVLVYGDTNSTLAGALAAAKLCVPVFHVEAGLRSFNRRMPEEVNRVLCDHLSALLFCPSRQAVANLEREGITDGVHFVGDVMYDATVDARNAALERSGTLEQLGLRSGAFALCTVHRAENTDSPERLEAILAYLEERAEELPLLWPIHPRASQAVSQLGISLSSRIRTIPPLGYLDMHCAVAHAATIFTDSGGLQKEAYFHRVPCVTLRDETEWIETVEAGWNRLWTEPAWRERKDIEDYGDGNAAGRIAAIVAQRLSVG